MAVQIRTERPGDIPAIEAVIRAAFLHAAHTSHTEHAIVHTLRAAGQLVISAVAQRHGEIVGHIAVSPVAISDGTRNWYGVGPLSVHPLHQRKGVGSALMRHALAALEERRVGGIVVLGEPGYYARFGFKPAHPLALPGVPQAYFQAIGLAGSLPAGTVSYHEAFAVAG